MFFAPFWANPVFRGQLLLIATLKALASTTVLEFGESVITDLGYAAGNCNPYQPAA
jgi:hypothetical protein